MTDAPAAQVGIVHVGLGEVGRAVAELVAGRANLRSVGAIDMDPALVGRSFKSLVTGGRDIMISDEMSAGVAIGAQVALHATRPSIAEIFPSIMACLDAGLHVVSTACELAWPWLKSPDLAKKLDKAARERGLVVVGTGINPGFALEYLSAVLAGTTSRIRHVRIDRYASVASRTPNSQEATGAGLPITTFLERLADWRIGHPWLPETAYRIADCLGWQLSGVRFTVEPVLERPSDDVSAGIHHELVAFRDGMEVMRLINHFSRIAEARNEIWIAGEPDVHFVVPGGLHGDLTAARTVVNAATQVARLPPGLRFVTDLPPFPPGRRSALTVAGMQR